MGVIVITASPPLATAIARDISSTRYSSYRMFDDNRFHHLTGQERFMTRYTIAVGIDAIRQRYP